MAKSPGPPWTDNFAFRVAYMHEGSSETMDQLCEELGVSPDQAEMWEKDTWFGERVRFWREEIIKGLGFRLKARIQAEEMLDTSFDLVHNPDVPPQTKADLIKATVKWAGLEPTSSELGGPGASAGVSIVINTEPKGGQSPVVISEARPVSEDE